MLEVAVALMLLTLFLVPVSHTAVALLGRSARLGDDAPGGEASDSRCDQWTWGPRIGAATWESASLIVADTRCVGGVGAEKVGWWLNGWFAGEASVPDHGIVKLRKPADIPVGDKFEVVIRARRASGPWGAPYRLLVAAPMDSAAGGRPDETPSSGFLLHQPAAGTCRISLMQADGSNDKKVSHGPFPGAVISGPAAVEMRGLVQRWMAVSGRDVDLYF